MKIVFILFYMALSVIGKFSVKAQSNVREMLSEKKYNEVSFLTTHNSYNSYEENYLFPNQNIDLSKQLNHGVRALMIDVYEVMGKLLVYHGFPFLGYKPASNFFNEIKKFLDDNPTEVITIIFESYASESIIEQELKKTKLFQYVYHHNSQNEWMKISEMIEKNQRLVVFTDKKPVSQDNDWYLYLWDYAFETHFAVHCEKIFDMKHLRGSPKNDFFILNHFITHRKVGFGKREVALKVNSATVINHRIKDALLYYGRIPNFLVLDFVEIGNGLEVIEILNQIDFWNNRIIPENDSQNKESILDNRLFYKTKKILKHWALLF